MATSLLDMRDIRKSYPTLGTDLVVLDGVSLRMEPGQTLALTGESGSGKSTLLHLAGGLDRPDGGQIHFSGQEIGGLDDAARAALRREMIGLIFQQFNLVPSLDVGANIALQARLAGRYDGAQTQVLAERLGLGELLTRYPEQLSGGQQQRVAIARALAGRPSLILADEPTGNLDEETGDAVLALLLELVEETGAALLMVTHSPRLARRLSDRVHLSRGAFVAAP